MEAYDLQTGDQVWKADLSLPSGSGYYLQLKERGLYVYQLGKENAIYNFDAQTGNLINKILILDIGGQQSSNLFLLNDHESLQAKDETIAFIGAGEVIWETDLDGIPRKFPWLYNDLIIAYFEGDNTQFEGIAGLDLMTGDVIWSRSGEFLSNFVILDELLYVISKDSDVLILNPETGQTVGYAEFLPNEIDRLHPISGIAANGEMLYVYFGDSQELIAFKQVLQ